MIIGQAGEAIISSFVHRPCELLASVVRCFPSVVNFLCISSEIPTPIFIKLGLNHP